MASHDRPLILIILDGFGERVSPKNNAVLLSRKPTLDRVRSRYPSAVCDASESHVGLPLGFMGNSEVGHLNIGAGRVVYQDFSLISREIETGCFFRNVAFLKLLGDIRESRKSLHLMGLVSDGGVHSHLSHLQALMELTRRERIRKVWIHAFTDGRDTNPYDGARYVGEIEESATKAGGTIATIGGRFYAMDRDKRWDRTQQAYRAIVEAKGESFRRSVEFIRQSYEQTGDEFIVPGVWEGYQGMATGDGLIFFNFRADRARQLTAALTSASFDGFVREVTPKLSGFVCMTPYDQRLNLPFAFEKKEIPSTLGEIVSGRGWKQLRIAETEKYAHVTYFFNGGIEKEFPGETRILIPSPRDVKTYDLKPEMAAREVTTRLIDELEKDFQFVVVNYANPDMVGHTGNLTAAIKAVEVVDECLGQIIDWVERKGAMAIITADHGNCEQMMSDDGTILTSHTLLKVPFIVIDPLRKIEVSPGRLCDIAPTILALWGINPPTEMTGRSLVTIV